MAKNTIVTRITLEGAQQITGELKNLGAAGERALAQIRKAADGANSGGARLAAMFSRVGTVFRQAGTAAQGFVRSIDNVERSVGAAARRIGLLTTVIVGAGAAFLAFNVKAGAAAEEIQNQASAVGLSAEQLQKFGFAAATVGLESDRFTQVMSVLTSEMEKTRDATDPLETALGRLGISVTDGSGNLRNAGDVLLEVAGHFKGLADGTDKSAAAIDIFGRRIGAKLIPFLNLGADGLQRMGNEAVRLGAAVSDETLGKLAAFDDALDVLKATAKGASLSIASIFAPALTTGANALTEIIAAQSGRLQAFAQELLTRVLPVIKDVINAISGNDADVSAQWVIDLRDNLIAFGEAARVAFFDILVPAFQAVVAAADVVAGVINGIFGTEFTGQALLIAAALLSLTGIFGVMASAIGVAVAAFGLLTSTVGATIAAVVLIGLDIVLLARTLAQIDWSGLGQRILDALGGAFNAIGGAIRGGFKSALDYVKGLFADLASYIESSWLGRIVSAVLSAIAQIRAAKSAADNAASAGAAAGARAGGLQAGGPAGRPGRRGIRDTVLAWLDPGEFVVRSEAVRNVGSKVLNFINNNGALPGFAMGGLVGAGAAGITPALAPIFERAENGAARSVLNLSIGGETFGGLLMDDDTAGRLARYAAGRRMVSNGRKPLWWGGN